MPRVDQKDGEFNSPIKCACGCGNMLLKYDKYGRSRSYLPGHGRRGESIRKFWNKVEKTGTCWLWTGGKTTAGYGSLTHNQHRYYAHRFAYELIQGDIPSGMELMHKCDNPACVNPEHLVVGTHCDNMRDAFGKLRILREPSTGQFYSGVQ